MIIIGGNSHPALSKNIAQQLQAPFIQADTEKFQDQELRIQLEGDLTATDVVIVQPTSPPVNENLIELLLLAEIVKRRGADRVTAVIPYFGYSRQDRPTPMNHAQSAQLVMRLIQAAGVDQVMTLDLHAPPPRSDVSIPIQNLDISTLFMPVIRSLDNCLVVFPDAGAAERTQQLQQKLGDAPVLINKSRNTQNLCRMDQITEEVQGRNCLLVDDIIDSGETVLQAAAFLKEKGAKSVSFCATHGVFSGDALERLARAKFHKIYVTDTIQQTDLPQAFQVISVAPLIAEAFRTMK